MSDLIRKMAGVAPRQETSFLRPIGSPVHYTDGTSEPAPASEAFYGAPLGGYNEKDMGDLYQKEMYKAAQIGAVPDMRAHIQPPDMMPEPQMQMPQFSPQQLNQVAGQQAQARPQRAPSMIAQQNAAGQQNYQAMLDARKQAFQQEMARRQQGMNQMRGF